MTVDGRFTRKRFYLAAEDLARLERIRQRYGCGPSECLRFVLIAAEERFLEGDRPPQPATAAAGPREEIVEVLRTLRSQAQVLDRCERLLVDLHHSREVSSSTPKAPRGSVKEAPAGSGDDADSEELHRLADIAFQSLAGQMLSGEMLGKFGRTGADGKS